MFPVFEVPRVNACFAVVASVPSAVKYAPPAAPAERDAVGVPLFTLITANLEEEVALEPIRKSREVLVG